MAAVTGGRDVVWMGDVPDELMQAEDETVTLEMLYRFFNRVDQIDELTLESVGYRLPSLSVGDFIAFDGKCWQVAGAGFTPVTHNADFLMQNFK